MDKAVRHAGCYDCNGFYGMLRSCSPRERVNPLGNAKVPLVRLGFGNAVLVAAEGKLRNIIPFAVGVLLLCAPLAGQPRTPKNLTQLPSASANRRDTSFATVSNASLLLDIYAQDGSSVDLNTFLNQTNFRPTSTWGIFQNYGVFPLGLSPSSPQVGSGPAAVLVGGHAYISFSVPSDTPLYFTCLWAAPSIGTVFMKAENAGAGYMIGANQSKTLELPYEFALSEYQVAVKLNADHPSAISPDTRARLDQAAALIQMAQNTADVQKRAIASYTALAAVMPLKEALVLDISNFSIRQSGPRGTFVLNYEGFGGWQTNNIMSHYARAGQAGFTYVLTICDWATISPQPGVYNFSALDAEVNSAIAQGYNVSISVNQSVEHMPQWMQNLPFDQLSALYYTNAKTFVDHYKNKIASIYPAAELELGRHGYSVAQLAELVKQSLTGARAAAPNMSFGLYMSASDYVGYQMNANSTADLISGWDLNAYLAKNNIKPDFIGLEMQYGTIFAPLDLQRIYEILNDFHAVAQTPIVIGETGYSSRGQDDRVPSPFYWHDGLTEQAQGDWADGFSRIALGLPFVAGLNWVHLDVDTPNQTEPELSSIVGVDLFQIDGTPKPVYYVFQNLTNSILLGEPNRFAPVIQTQSPTSAIGAVAGANIEFTASARDADGNSLTYRWSVDGVTIADSFGPTFTWSTSGVLPGVHVVALNVSDGWRAATRIWRVNIAAGKKFSVLFDETHSERTSIDLNRARQIYPQEPDLASMASLAAALAPYYQVSALTTASISAQTLSGIDVLVLAAPNAIVSAAENQAITQFVRAGGGLIFLGDSNLNPAINSLLASWNIQFDPAPLLSPQSSGCPGCFSLATFADLPGLGQASYQVGYGGSLTVSGGATVWGKTSAAEWKSTSGQPPQKPGEPNGPFNMIAIAQSGSGKIVALGDNGFYDQFFSSYPGNGALFNKILGWLTVNKNPTNTPPPAGAMPSITSVLSSGSYANAASPGSWATIFGQNLSDIGGAGRAWGGSDFQGNDLPLALNGTSVLVNGRPAAISFVSSSQLNIQIPDDLTEGPVDITVTAPAGTGTGTANLKQIAPSTFTYTVSGTNYVAAVAVDGTLIGPSGFSGARPAKPGETIEIFGTGFGAAVPKQPSGHLVNSSPLASPVVASVCGQIATVQYAGLIAPGLNQINVIIPQGVTGSCSVVLSMNGAPTQENVTMPVV